MDPILSTTDRARLPRLAPVAYRGHAAAHWTMTLEARSTGWLDATHHATLREILLHACHRYALACPVYCLMPDHAHFLWQGLADTSDQRLAAAWFRRQWNALLAPAFTLQRQAHDHVLREPERTHDAFPKIAAYILQNPERAKNSSPSGATGPTSAQSCRARIPSIRAIPTSGTVFGASTTAASASSLPRSGTAEPFRLPQSPPFPFPHPETTPSFRYVPRRSRRKNSTSVAAARVGALPAARTIPIERRMPVSST